MEFRDAIRRRRMVRRYTSEEVPPDALRAVLEAALQGPSAGFSQGQSFVVVRDAQTRAALAELAGEPDYTSRGFEPWLSSAPVHVILCTSKRAYRERYARSDKVSAATPGDWSVPYWILDAGAALMLLLVAAVDQGLAAGFIGAHRLHGVEALLDIPSEISVVGLVTLGYPAPDRRSGSLDAGRLPFEEQVHFERW